MQIFKRRFWAKAKNDAGERIESLRFSVPALRVGVLEYGVGQLQTNNAELDGKPVRLYYPPESVSDKKFLKTLETAPVVVGGHENTTGEHNKKIDGWAHGVSYDEAAKAAIINGVVKGAKEVAYVKSNFGNSGFGASAFVDIFNLKVESGTTPDGESYNAIAYDLRATHVALAPNVRDPQNKIKVNNAVCVRNTGEIKNSEDSKMDIDPKELAALVKNAVEETMKAENEVNEMEELKSAITLLGEAVKEIKEAMGGSGDAGAGAVNKDGEEPKKEEEKKEEEKEGVTLENAKPSQAVVAAFASAMNIDFGTKTPSFKVLADLAGIKAESAVERISAVNAKFEEFTKKSQGVTKNASDEQGAF